MSCMNDAACVYACMQARAARARALQATGEGGKGEVGALRGMENDGAVGLEAGFE